MRGFIVGLVIGLAFGVVLAVSLPQDGSDTDRPDAGAKPSLAGKAVSWKMSSAFPARMAPIGALAKQTALSITRASGGMIEVELRGPDGSVPALDIFDAVSSAAIDAAFSSPAYWAEKSPALQLFAGLPFGPEPREFLAWFLHGGGQKAFEKLYQRRNIHALACGLTIPGGGWFKSQVSAPADFKGLNVAAAGLASKVLAKLGVEPALFAAGDIRQALKQGSVAGALVSLPSADLSLEIQREAKNYYFPGWQHQAGVLELLINLERWRALGREQQTRIRQVCVANLGASLAAGEAAQFGALKQLVLDGVEVRRWSPEMIKALGNAWSAVLADEIARDKDFKRIWKGLKEFRTDYAIWRELGYL